MHSAPVELNEDYVVYPDGNVWSKRNKMFLKPVLASSGYLTYSPSVTKGLLSPTVHRILAYCYLGAFDQGMVVNHKDGNKLNNSLDNLEVVTYSQNTRHAREMGLFRHIPSEENPMARLTVEQIEQIHGMFHAGSTNDEVALAYGIHPRYVSLIRHGKRWPEQYNKNGPFPNSQKAHTNEQKYLRFLELADSHSNAAIARFLELNASTVSRWRSNGARVK